MDRRRASAFCRRAEPQHRRRTAAPGRGGFTLIELLVVLAIMAGLSAIAYPQVVTWYAGVRAAFARSDLEQQLNALPQQVRASGRAGILADPTASPQDVAQAAAGDPALGLERPRLLRLRLPSGWHMRVPRPVLYHFTGACDGGEVVFSLPPVSLRYRLRQPLCLPRLADAR
jgi:prepilin-type N-terminal cleavage/methylation domain-containing protein